MIYIEAALLTTLLFTFILVVRTDIKYSTISNKNLLFASTFCCVLNIIYYYSFAREYFVVYIVNFLAMFSSAILFYAYNLWAAGDSKLLMFVCFAIPGRMYFINYRGVLPGFVLLILIFLFAYIYIVGESIYLGIKSKNLFKIKKVKFDLVFYFKNLLVSFVVMTLINEILLLFFGTFFSANNILLTMIDFFILLTIINFKFFRNWWVVSFFLAAFGILLIFDIIRIHFTSFDYKPYVIVLIVLILRFISDKYNYSEIPTSQLKAGMILSVGAIVCFTGSKVSGLPQSTTEDLRSRLSPESVESILLWEKSKLGCEKITIVRKIPFAVFIAIGTIVFLILEVI